MTQTTSRALASTGGAVLATALMLAMTAAVAAERNVAAGAPPSTKQTLRFTGAGPHTLEVRTLNGVIHVEASGGPDVELQVDKSIRASTAAARAEAEREVTLEVSGDAPVVKAIVHYGEGTPCGQGNGQRNDERNRGDGWNRHWNWNWPDYEVTYDFTVRVPRDTNLVLCTINGDEVTVRGVRGDFSIHNVNGRIRLDGVEGAGEAITVNGAIDASFQSAPRAESLFRTVNGDVDVHLPDGGGADLSMKTFNGDIYTDFEPQAMTQLASTPEQRGNRTVYRSNQYTTVRIGGGGPKLTLNTLNGDVRVLRRAP